MVDDVTYSLAKALLERRYDDALDLLTLLDAGDPSKRAWVTRLRDEIREARRDRQRGDTRTFRDGGMAREG